MKLSSGRFRPVLGLVLFCFAAGVFAQPDRHEMELQILLNFYQITSAECSWIDSGGWSTAQNQPNYCSWFGITCDDDGFVAAIDLDENNLCGELPQTSFLNLTSLYDISLQGNQLTGIIPQFPASLQLFSLSDNPLNSQIPDHIGNMPQLLTMYLSNNGLYGSIPTTMTRLSSLKLLTLSGNAFTGTVPTFLGQMPLLAGLMLADNQFEYFPGFPSPSIGIIDLHGNPLRMSIEQLLVNAAQVNTLNLLYASQCGLSGTLDSDAVRDALITLPLRLLDLSSNNISGTIPLFWQQTSKFLQTLDLRNNSFVGQVPDELRLISTLLLANNAGLHRGSAQRESYPDFVQLDYNVMNKMPGRDQACPGWRGIENANLLFTLDASYYDYEFCICLPGYYNWRGQCLPCLQNAICEQGVMRIPEGFAPCPFPNTTELQSGNFSTTTFYISALLPCYQVTPSSDISSGTQCNPNNLCTDLNPATSADCLSTFTCGAGYVARLCSRCDRGYYQSGRACEPCRIALPRAVLIGVYASLACVVGGLVVAILVNVQASSEGILKMFTTYMSLLSLLVDSGLPLQVYITVALYTITAPFNLEVLSLDCALPPDGTPPSSSSDWQQRFLIAYILDIFAPLLVAIYLYLVYWVYIIYRRLLRRKWDQEIAHWWRNRCVSVLLFAMGLVYYRVCLRTMEVWTCIYSPVEQLAFLDSRPYIICDNTITILRGISVFPTLLWLFGIPIAIGVIIYRNRHAFHCVDHNDYQVVRDRYGFLVLTYRPECYLWELTVYLRKFILAALVILVPSSGRAAFLMPIGVFLTLSALVGFQTHNRPYWTSKANSIEMMSFFALIITFFGGILMGLPTIAPSASIIAIVLLCINTVMVALFLLFLAMDYFPRVYSFVEGVRKRGRALTSRIIATAQSPFHHLAQQQQQQRTQIGAKEFMSQPLPFAAVARRFESSELARKKSSHSSLPADATLSSKDLLREQQQERDDSYDAEQQDIGIGIQYQQHQQQQQQDGVEVTAASTAIAIADVDESTTTDEEGLTGQLLDSAEVPTERTPLL